MEHFVKNKETNKIYLLNYCLNYIEQDENKIYENIYELCLRYCHAITTKREEEKLKEFFNA